jgi:hypothetical protein
MPAWAPQGSESIHRSLARRGPVLAVTIFRMAPCRHRALSLALTVPALLIAVAACRVPTADGPAPTGVPTTGAASGPLAADDKNAPMPAPGTCHIGQRDGQSLPDPHCTPGAINPQVTQNTIKDTICRSGWTKTVRPSTSLTDRMKAQSAKSYSLAPGEKGEYDHLVSLELGGAPDDPRNLWVEPGSIPNPKDAVENKLSDAVCSGLVPLATAQTAIASNWVTAFDQAGLRVSGSKVCLRDDPAKCATGKGAGDGE